jgi:hypothetical protein
MKLGMNDYNMESVNEKSTAYARIAKRLLDKGVPLHFMGRSDGPEPFGSVHAFPDVDAKNLASVRFPISFRRGQHPPRHRRIDEAIHRPWLGGSRDRIGREGSSRPRRCSERNRSGCPVSLASHFSW